MVYFICFTIHALANWDNLICKSPISCLRLSTVHVQYFYIPVFYLKQIYDHAKGEVILFVESIVENI